MFWKKSPQGPPGKEAAPQGLLPMHALALTLGTWGGKPVELRGRNAALHKHIMGTTGSGKTGLLESLVLQLGIQRKPFCIVDPHGDAADRILQFQLDTGFYQNEQAFSRIRYLDLSRTDRFLPFNVLEQPGEPSKTALAVWEAWTRAWGGLAGGNAPMLEGFVKAGCFVLAANHEPLTRLADLLTNSDFREQLLAHVHDPMILDYFARYESSGLRRGSADASSTLRRIFNLTFSPSLRYTLGQRTNALPFRALMDQGVSLIVNLGGLLPEEQRLLGCLLTVGIEEAALSRVDIPEEQRLPFHLILDEFAQFSAQSSQALERVLALTRKYGLSLCLAHQAWGQAEPLQSALQNACFIAFTLGRDDAHYAASRVADIDLARTKASPTGRPVFVGPGEQRLEWEQTLMTLPPRQAVLRLGQQTLRFQTLGIPAPKSSREQLAALKEAYAQRYLVSRSDIERQMHAAHGPSLSTTSSSGSAQQGRVIVDEERAGTRQPQAGPLALPARLPEPRTPGTRRARRQIPLDGDTHR